MPKFRKKPIMVEAEQFLPPDKLPEGVIKGGWWRTGYYINTLEGAYMVSPEDWIITGINGEKYPCNPDIFKKTYEYVEE